MTKTILISNAIGLLGHKVITSLDNADQMTNAAIQAFDLLAPDILSQNNWRFATAIQPLVQLLEVPPQPWGSVYQLPSGYLKLIRLYPNIYEFDIYNNSRIYTIFRTNIYNQVPPPIPNNYNNSGQQLSIEYIFQPPVEQWPARFNTMFVYAIACHLALTNAQRPDYAAYLNQQLMAKYAMAAASEAQNRPQFSQVIFPVLANRNIGGFVGNTSGAG